MNLDDLDEYIIMDMLYKSLECYCKLLRKGIYKGKKFDKCREEMRALTIALKRAILLQKPWAFFRRPNKFVSHRLYNTLT